MGDGKTFTGMDAASRRFYSPIFTTALFNIYAVRNRLFRELLCESSDPMILVRWARAEPLIIKALTGREDTERRDDQGRRDT